MRKEPTFTIPKPAESDLISRLDYHAARMPVSLDDAIGLIGAWVDLNVAYAIAVVRTIDANAEQARNPKTHGEAAGVAQHGVDPSRGTFRGEKVNSGAENRPSCADPDVSDQANSRSGRESAISDAEKGGLE